MRLKTVMIDDERPALRGLEYFLGDQQAIEIAGMFTNPLEAIERIADIMPQIVFLDINMPQLQGIDAASRILDLCPDTDIIFITAYEQYAIEAFELHALDYLLKPITKERFDKTLQRIMEKKGIKQNSADKRLEIQCFGGFQVGWFQEEPIKWRTEKTRELFAFLLLSQGRIIPKEEIIDKIWPEVEIEKAFHQLYNGIYYIRKTLEQYGIESSLMRVTGTYGIKIGAVDFDVLRFRECLTRIKSDPTTENLETLEALGKGEYLEGSDWPWAYLEREKLSRQYSEVLTRLAQVYMEKKKFNRAEELLLKVFKNDPYDENITEMLLKLYIKTDNKPKALRHLLEYEKILKEELAIRPKENIQKLYASIR